MKITYIFFLLAAIAIGGFVLSHSFEKAESVGPVQVVKATYGPPFGFVPIQMTVKAGQPVRLEVEATEDGRGCMGSITIPRLNNQIQSFKKGQVNVFEFTPQTPGTYPVTCAMGIPHGDIIVR
ncbi:MAG: cupredoxin domain-containing protein [Candidatus Shapirobacteria bacterium]|jgi:plastocyanin domain-containing protein